MSSRLPKLYGKLPVKTTPNKYNMRPIYGKLIFTLIPALCILWIIQQTIGGKLPWTILVMFGIYVGVRTLAHNILKKIYGKNVAQYKAKDKAVGWLLFVLFSILFLSILFSKTLNIFLE